MGQRMDGCIAYWWNVSAFGVVVLSCVSPSVCYSCCAMPVFGAICGLRVCGICAGRRDRRLILCLEQVSPVWSFQRDVYSYCCVVSFQVGRSEEVWRLLMCEGRVGWILQVVMDNRFREYCQLTAGLEKIAWP